MLQQHLPTMLDFNDASIDSLPGQEMQSLAAGCRAAAAERLGRAPDERVPLRSRLESPIVHDAPKGGGVSIAYLVMAHRAFAHASVGRLIRVLWDRAHLFMLHFDLRANTSMIEFLHSKFESAPNIRFMEHRRAVGWGAFSMVSVLLEAMATAFGSPPGFDFFINLSDADLPLRTNAELTGFLGGFRGRSFVSVKFPHVDELRYHAHAHMRRSSWLECSGRGFLVVNQTAATLFGNEPRRCCYARSGPIVYAPLPLGRPAPPDGWEFFHGSQWGILARDAVEYLLRAPRAVAFAQHLELTYMSDETFLQTALMNAPTAIRRSLVNHNLRYIDWPHGYGDPTAYWRAVGMRHASGPMVLSSELMGAVLGSGAAFARKIDLEAAEGVAFVDAWDKWMTLKMAADAATATASVEMEAATATASGAAAAAAPAAAAAAAASAEAGAKPEAHGHGQSDQPAIAADLLAEDPTLRAIATPPLAAEREGVGAAEVMERWPPRAVHYGHEDVMHKQFTPQPPPPPPPPSKGRGVAPWRGPNMEGAESEVARRAAAEVAAEVAVAEEALPPARRSPPQLARIVFSDGSACSCHVGCAATHECCDDHPEACATTALGTGPWSSAEATSRA